MHLSHISQPPDSKILSLSGYLILGREGGREGAFFSFAKISSLSGGRVVCMIILLWHLGYDNFGFENRAYMHTPFS